MATPDSKAPPAPGSTEPPDAPAQVEREPQEAEARPARRTVTLAVIAGGCALAAAAAIPAAALVAAPVASKGGGGRWVRTLRVEQLSDDQPKRVAIVADRRDAWTIERNVELGSVWLVKHGDTITAFSAVCPHLGCSVNVAPRAGAAGGFACPCHTSAFDHDGKRQSGPSPRDLDVLATRIEEGFVAVDFRRFRIGIPEKVEA